MSRLYLAIEQNIEAMKYILQAMAIAEEKLPATHSDILEYRETLQTVCNEL